MKTYVKFNTLFFQNVLVFTDLFYRYHYPFISYTQTACDVMCVQHVKVVFHTVKISVRAKNSV